MHKIAKVAFDDIHEVKELLNKTWSDTYQDIYPSTVTEMARTVWHHPDLLLEQSKNPYSYFAVAKDESNKIIGLITLHIDKEGEIFLTRLFVDPTFQRKGIGEALFLSGIETFSEAKKVTVEVDEKNIKGFNFYKKHGFKEVSRKEEEIAKHKANIITLQKTFNT